MTRPKIDKSSAAVQAAQIKRNIKRTVNETLKKDPLGPLPYKSDRANNDTRKGTAGFTRSALPPGAATAPTWNTLKDKATYDGAELRPFDGRKGAMDAYALPSRGLG